LAFVFSQNYHSLIWRAFRVLSQLSKKNHACLWPSEAYITLNGKLGKAMADQLATVSKLRLFKKVGTLSGDDMQKIGGAIRIQLDLK